MRYQAIISVLLMSIGFISEAATTIPQGTWKIQAVVDSSTFPQFIAIHYPKYAIGIINQNYSPTVVECPDVHTTENCHVLAEGLSEFEFNNLTDLSYLSEGQLIASFIQSQPDAINPDITHLMQFTQQNEYWQPFSEPFVGTVLGLTLSKDQSTLLLSYAYNDYISQYGYESIASTTSLDTAGQIIQQQHHLQSSHFNTMVDDGIGHLFVSGPKAHYLTPDHEPAYHIWMWNQQDSNPQTAYIPITMPNDITSITDMISDGQGTLYISGGDAQSDGHVWRYVVKTAQFEDTQIPASYISALVYSPNGDLLAGGIDRANNAGAVWSYQNAQWVNLSLPESTSVVSIATDAHHHIMVSGMTQDQNAAIWLFTPEEMLSEVS